VRVGRRARGLALAWLVAACGEDGATDVDAATATDVGHAEARDDATLADTAIDTTLASDTTSDPDGGPATPEFQVVLIEAHTPGFAPVPIVTAGRIYVESTEAGTTVGDCTFYPALPPPFCDPPCAIGSVCIDDDTCGAPLEPLGAGDISVSGGEVGISLHPETQYFYYVPTLTPEPVDGDLFAPDAHLVARATGGNVPAFELAGRGVEDLVTPLACPPPLAADVALVVTWTAGDGGNVHLDIESGNHAGQFARIACDSPDDGEIVVAGSLVASYLAAGRPLDLWRLARENVTAVGRARLYVASQVSCRW